MVSVLFLDVIEIINNAEIDLIKIGLEKITIDVTSDIKIIGTLFGC